MALHLLLVFLVALLVSGALIPSLIRLAPQFNAVSRPGGRHVHRAVVPRIGGLAIAVGFFVSVAVVVFPLLQTSTTTKLDPLLMTGLLGGALGMTMLGLLDDIRGVRALHKLGFQVAIAVGAFMCGVQIPSVYVPFIGGVDLGWLSAPVTVFWIVAVINAINLIDGLDGLAGGVAIFAALANLVVALVTGNVLVALFMTAAVGTTLGFLRYNFNPARIFMGDSGSYFLGFILATVAVLGPQQKTSTAISILVPIIALGLPIFDTLFAIVRRFIKRQPLFAADRGHIHHRLLDLGLTTRRAVLILYGISIAFTVAALTLALGREWSVGIALVMVSTVGFGVARFVILPAHRARRAAEAKQTQVNKAGIWNQPKASNAKPPSGPALRRPSTAELHPVVD